MELTKKDLYVIAACVGYVAQITVDKDKYIQLEEKLNKILVKLEQGEKTITITEGETANG